MRVRPIGFSRFLITMICFVLVANLCRGASQGEPNAMGTPTEYPIPLVYGYRYYETDESAYFMADHIESLLADEGLHVDIRFSSDYRLKDSWHDYHENLKTILARGDCSVHALSLTSEFLSTINPSDLHNIRRTDLEKFAPNYYRDVLIKRKGHDLHYVPNSDSWYALTGYRYVEDFSNFVLATTYDHRSTFVSKTPLYSPPILPDLKLHSVRPVAISKLRNALMELSRENSQPYFAWKSFEYSFAPIYSAFGISTVGANLMTVRLTSIPVAPDGTTPAQISDEYRAFIRELSEWYDLGLINTDFDSISYRTAVEQAKGYSVISIPYLRTTMAPDPLFRAVAEGQENIFLFQVNSGDYDRAKSLRSSPFYEAEAYPSCVDSDMIEPLLRIFEYARLPVNGDPRTAESGWMKRVFGLQEKHYRVTRTTEGSTGSHAGYTREIQPYRISGVEAVWRPPGYRSDEGYAMWHFKARPEITLEIHDETRLLIDGNPSYYQVSHEATIEPHADLIVGSIRHSRDLSAQISDDHIDTGALSDLTRATAIKWIKGAARAVDDEWDAYVSDWKTAGGQAIINILEEG